MTSQVVLGYFLSFEIAGEFILRFLWLFLEYLKTKEAWAWRPNWPQVSQRGHLGRQAFTFRGDPLDPW